MPLTGQNKLTRGAVDRGIQTITGAFDQGAAGPFKSFVNTDNVHGLLGTVGSCLLLSTAVGRKDDDNFTNGCTKRFAFAATASLASDL